MFDKLKFNFKCEELPVIVKNQLGEVFEWNNILFSPKVSRKFGTIHYDGFERNLKISIYPSETMIIENSIHKYFHGNNYSDFFYKDVKAAIELLSDKFSFHPQQSCITQLEYGCNTFLNSGARVYQEFSGLRGKDSENMVSGGIRYGKVVQFNEYRLKLYDKTYESFKAKKEDILLRSELACSNMKYLRNRKASISIYTLNDLLDKAIWISLTNDLIEKLVASRSTCIIDPNLIQSREELAAYSFFTGPLNSKTVLRKKYPRDYRMYRSIYMQMLQRYPGVFQDALPTIQTKLKNLLES